MAPYVRGTYYGTSVLLLAKFLFFLLIWVSPGFTHGHNEKRLALGVNNVNLYITQLTILCNVNKVVDIMWFIDCGQLKDRGVSCMTGETIERKTHITSSLSHRSITHLVVIECTNLSFHLAKIVSLVYSGVGRCFHLRGLQEC